jgi:hypothetical protein
MSAFKAQPFVKTMGACPSIVGGQLKNMRTTLAGALYGPFQHAFSYSPAT